MNNNVQNTNKILGFYEVILNNSNLLEQMQSTGKTSKRMHKYSN
jgi:hypothetical protein